MKNLKVHPGGRFLETEDGAPFFWLGDTAWELFHALTREEAEAIVATYSCRAGTSEHQTGLAVDLRVRGDDQSLLNESFADTQAGRWLAENCARFGFVLRFPKDKTSVTGIQFEPWHFRFVGYRAANEMTEKGMCLEEYSAYLYSLSAE